MEKLLQLIMHFMDRGFRFVNEPVNLDTLQERLFDINQQMTDIINTAEAEDRELSEDDLENLEGMRADFKRCEKQIEAIKNVLKQQQKLREGMGRKTEPEPPADPQNVQPAPTQSRRLEVEPRATKGNHGFRNLGEFANAVRGAKGVNVDPRLIKNAPTTYSTEGVGADGGYAVPPDFRTEIMEKVMGEESLIGRTDQMTTTGNSITFPKDETTPWQSSGGILAYWESEASQLTQSKVALESSTLKTNKLTALVPVSEELLEDAPSLDGYLRRKVPQKFDYKLQNALLEGTGAGEPLGILNAGCTVSIAKESGQSADTLVFANIVNMWSRMYAPCRSRAVWHINQDVEPQLLQMTLEGTSSSVPAYMPANGLAGSPYATLMGRPVIPLQGCNTLGDKGDIYLCDWSQYLTVVKAGGIRTDVSIHLYFDYDMTAFRFVMRVTGQPWWRTYITPASGSTNYLSCFVTLDARA